jgi:hypothetical protein
MDWFQTSETRQEHRRLTKMAVAHFKDLYPGEPVDMTKAQADYAEYLGLPTDYFRLYRNGGILTAQKVEESLNLAILPACPECGQKLTFDSTDPMFRGCSKVNPGRYTGLLYCSSETCLWHGYTTEGLTDIYNKLRVSGGGLGTVKIVAGVV